MGWGLGVESKVVTVKFDGNIDGVAVDTFTQVMVSYAHVLDLAAAEIDPNIKLGVNITATRPGCLEAVLKAVVDNLPGLLSSLAQAAVPQLPLVIQTVSSYLELRRRLGRDGAPTSVEQDGDNYSIRMGNDSTVNVTKNVYNIAMTPEVAKATGTMFSALSTDPKIGGLEVKADGVKPFVAPAEEFGAIKNAPAPVVDDTRVELREHEILAVTKAVLEPDAKLKWQFLWQGVKVSGTVSDMEFFDKLKSHEWSFGIGDCIDADLEIKRRRNGLGLWENDAYRVVRVHDVLPGPQDQRMFD